MINWTTRANPPYRDRERQMETACCPTLDTEYRRVTHLCYSCLIKQDQPNQMETFMKVAAMTRTCVPNCCPLKLMSAKRKTDTLG